VVANTQVWQQQGYHKTELDQRDKSIKKLEAHIALVDGKLEWYEKNTDVKMIEEL